MAPKVWGNIADSSTEPPTLADVKVRLKAAIDISAEVERLKYITGGAGQAMACQQKSD
ncbi:hypothetical protein J2W42_006848 [Rhizobium tibeticum]|uniref:hypothetical protein n=1 Tax=Rhizobium tibeticum TaxID=501024 RepID=UPI00278516D9|nr:hypothetical protein [Rhizobium tibeticum]MDP9813971.1 hypothetical protein [Rhizobium tibeticum]